MVGVFSWNDVDVLFTFNNDLDLKLTFFQGHKIFRFFQHYTIDGYGTTLYLTYISHRSVTIELRYWQECLDGMM